MEDEDGTEATGSGQRRAFLRNAAATGAAAWAAPAILTRASAQAQTSPGGGGGGGVPPFRYLDTFQDPAAPAGGVWSTRTRSAVPADPARVYNGPFENFSTSVLVSGLTAGASTTVEFDLYILDSWDGINASSTINEWFWSIDGAQQLITTFSVIDEPPGPGGYEQNYPDPSGGATHPPYFGSVSQDTLGYDTVIPGISLGWGDAVYHITATFNAGGTSVLLAWGAQGLETPPPNESWGLDNVLVVQ